MLVLLLRKEEYSEYIGVKTYNQLEIRSGLYIAWIYFLENLKRN